MNVPKNGLSRIYFVLAVVVLAGSATAMQIFDFRILKKPLPIRKPLNDFDSSSIRPFIKDGARILSPDVVAELGTDVYIEWSLSDPRIKDKERSKVSLFLTYYTNVQDQVPHVPEECYTQGQYTAAGDDSLTWIIDSLGGEEVAIRRLAFLPPKELKRKNFVYYTINVNGAFFAGRQGARLKMSAFDETHLYYSKVEIAFNGYTDADIPELDRRAKELMNLTIKELIDEHWPQRGTEKGGYEALAKKN